MLRRILSPRQPPEGKSSSNTRGGQFVDSKPRSQSSSAIQFNGGHCRRGSDESDEVKNTSYGDPDKFQAPVRTQSMVSTPTKEMNPPLPPRNVMPPYGESDPSSVYVTPADTLRQQSAASSGSSSYSPSPVVAVSSQSQGSTDPDALPATRSERRVMQMHQLTMNQTQRRVQGGVVATNTTGTAATRPVPSNGGSNHQRTSSLGNMTENSDYSVPFQADNANRRQVRPPMSRMMLQSRESGECIIPINPPSTSPQPPSDRSDTNSPSSPMSNQSSEQEPPAPPRQEEGNSDYAVPWDRSRILQSIPHMHRNVRRARASDDLGSSQQHKSQDRELHQHMAEHNIRENSQQGPEFEVSPPPPELPFDPYRPHRNRGVSDRVHYRTEGSTSPVGVNRGDDVRFHSQSVSHVRHPPSRLDPHDRGRLESCPLPPPRDQSAVTIDVSVPLKDQPWYHGHVTRAEAEDILRDQPDFSFLVRKSESCQTDYSLSIRDTSPSSAAGFYHLRLVFEKDPPGYVLGQFSSHFEKVTECIAFYTKQRLNIRGAEHKRLRFPIPRGKGYLTTVGV